MKYVKKFEKHETNIIDDIENIFSDLFDLCDNHRISLVERSRLRKDNGKCCYMILATFRNEKSINWTENVSRMSICQELDEKRINILEELIVCKKRLDDIGFKISFNFDNEITQFGRNDFGIEIFILR